MAEGNEPRPYDETTIPKYFSGFLIWDSTKNCFPITVLPSTNAQITYVVRNNNTGALYVCWYNSGLQGFEIGTTVYGSAPTNGQRAYFEYFTS